MGLVEKISQAQADARIELQKRQEAIEVAARLRQAVEDGKLQAKALADQKKIDERTAFVAELASLLDVVGAREQLEEVRKVWTVGEIDATPHEPVSERYHSGDRVDEDSYWLPRGVGIALRYRFTGIEDKRYISGGCLEGDTSEYVKEGSDLYEAEAALYVITRITKNVPYVITSYQCRHLGGTVYYRDNRTSPSNVDEEYYWRMRSVEIGSAIGADIIFPDNPNFSRNILEKQLIKTCAMNSNPLTLEADARRDIINDDYLPNNIKSRFRPKVVSPPLSWYKRLFS